MAATITENENLPIGHFTPFNDINGPAIQKAIQVFVNTEQGYDTTVIDRFRQGVNIRLPRHLYQTNQPKIWSGRYDHQTSIITLGQARSFVEFGDSILFEEKPKFNPTWYTEDSEYPFPIIFNDGPQQEEEASVEPFTIPMRKKVNEGPFYPRSIKASLEDGNNLDDLCRSTTRVEQFIEYNPPLVPRFFLDEGQGYFGGVIKPNYLDLTFDPVALYQLDSLLFVDSAPTGASPSLQIVSGTVVISDGPFIGAHDNKAALFDSNSILSHTVTGSETNITGNLTAECFFNLNTTERQYIFSQSPRDSSETTLPENNVLFGVLVSLGDGTVTYFHQSGSGENKFTTVNTGSFYKTNTWNHVAVTRTMNETFTSASIKIYLNGSELTTVVGGSSTLANPSNGENTVLNLGSDAFDADFRLSGSLASVKILNKVLSAEEILQEANYLTESKFNDGAIRIEGFIPVNIRNVNPFDDTRDESIVASLQTSDQAFISAVKQLDFDLSEDIRGTFDKKSAPAGGDVYGPTAAIYGTDSISYRNTMRGA